LGLAARARRDLVAFAVFGMNVVIDLNLCQGAVARWREVALNVAAWTFARRLGGGGRVPRLVVDRMSQTLDRNAGRGAGLVDSALSFCAKTVGRGVNSRSNMIEDVLCLLCAVVVYLQLEVIF